jgi:tetratricopeptide (TPR) repeat protein
MPRSNSIRTDRAAPDGDPFAQGYARLRAKRPLRKLRLQQIASDLRGGRAESAQEALRGYLSTQPDDADALCLEAQTAERLGRRSEAASRFARCLELAPDFAAARYHYASLLLRLHHYEPASREVEQLLAGDRRNPLLRRLKALILDAIGEEQQSLLVWKDLADEHPGHADCWIHFGQALRATGNQASSIAAFRRAIACRQSSGQAWWSLANMKTFRFTDEDISVMRHDFDRTGIGAEDRVNLLFALGKAYEDEGAFAKSFEHYAKGNAARRLRTDYDWDDINSELAAQKKLYTREFLESRNGAGCKAPDPIFILGRPRSGSTLIEQILSSHSAVEGTAELPHIADFAWRFLEGECVARSIDYPQILAELPSAALTAMGEEYLERTRIHRKLGRPFFIDKSPANYHHVGMILLILPNVKIIDARRHPAACCFSMFKHNYSETNLRLNELGLVYRNYVELMAHFDRVMPGRIHRAIYENMVADPEAEIRSLLDYLELPFEENCLRFYATERTIRTPSSEQVRRPISGEAVGHWRHFEPWLRPLLDSLGPVVTEYPRVPEDLR